MVRSGNENRGREKESLDGYRSEAAFCRWALQQGPLPLAQGEKYDRAQQGVTDTPAEVLCPFGASAVDEEG